jgi:hypothetical protein
MIPATRSRRIAVLCLSAKRPAAGGASVTTASADEPSLQAQSDHQLAVTQGGVQTGPNEVSYQVTQYLANFDFTAMTSSWANTKNGGAVYVYNGNTLLWTEHPNTKDASLGADDNHATHFTCQD